MGGRATLSQLLKIRVNQPLQGSDDTTPAADLQLPALASLPAPSLTRVQHLSETIDPLTDAPITLNVEDAPYLDEQTHLPDVTTKPIAGAVEDWLLVNTTADTHPIHLHLVTFEVIDRRPFDVDAYNPNTQTINYTGPAVPAAPNENGRKDTVQAHPGQVTRIRARFELPDEGDDRTPSRRQQPPIRLALPHPRTRRKRHDARLRGRQALAPRTGSPRPHHRRCARSPGPVFGNVTRRNVIATSTSLSRSWATAQRGRRQAARSKLVSTSVYRLGEHPCQ